MIGLARNLTSLHDQSMNLSEAGEHGIKVIIRFASTSMCCCVVQQARLAGALHLGKIGSAQHWFYTQTTLRCAAVVMGVSNWPSPDGKVLKAAVAHNALLQ